MDTYIVVNAVRVPAELCVMSVHSFLLARALIFSLPYYQ